MSRIFKPPFMRRHIDLDKIISIGDAAFIDRMGHGGWFVGFTILVQLRDEPIFYERCLEQDTEERFEMPVGHQVLLLDGTWSSEPSFLKDPTQIVAVANLQRDIDSLIEEWKKS